MSNDIAVSIIIPVYNAGNYLRKCLDSLINQTLRNIEIIAVLDCPTDGSDKIVDEYSLYDERIVIVRNKSNLNIGRSRNEGLKIARGKYIGFCDHDDYCNKQMFELLYNKAENEEIDLVCSPYVLVKNDVVVSQINYPEYPADLFAKKIFNTCIGINHPEDDMINFMLSGVIWNKLFKTNVIRENNIQFIDNNVIMGEDLLFMIEYANNCSRAGRIDTPLYFHCVWSNNTNLTYSYHSVEKTVAHLEYIATYLQLHSYADNDIKSRFYNSIKVQLLISLMYTYHCRGLRYTMLELQRVRQNPFIKEAFIKSRNIIFTHSTTKKRLIHRIISFIVRCS